MTVVNLFHPLKISSITFIWEFSQLILFANIFGDLLILVYTSVIFVAFYDGTSDKTYNLQFDDELETLGGDLAKNC